MPMLSYGDIPFFTLQLCLHAIVGHLLDALRILAFDASWVVSSAANSDVHAFLPA
jgi:hypothetical protein